MDEKRNGDVPEHQSRNDCHQARDAVRKRFGEDPEGLVAAGEVLYARGDVQGGLDLFLKALEENPQHLEALNNVGAVLAEGGELGRALSYLRRALEQDLLHRETVFNCALVLATLGHTDEAVNLCQVYLRHVPGDADVTALASKLSGEVSDPGKQSNARDTVIESIKLGAPWLSRDDETPDELVAHGENFYTAGAKDEARRQFERALAADVTHVDALNNLGVLNWEEGDITSALDCFRRALAREPNRKSTVLNCAIGLAALGRTNEAHGICRCYLQVCPDDLEVRNVLRGIQEGDDDGDRVAVTACDLEAGMLAHGLETYRTVCDYFGSSGDGRSLQRVAEVFVKPNWVTGSITDVDALFLYEMVQSVAPEKVIELGTASGSSSGLLLLALADAGCSLLDAQGSPALHSFDIGRSCYFDETRVVGAAAYEMVPWLAHGVTFHRERTAQSAAKMFERSPVKLAFIDGDHRHPWPTVDLLTLLPALQAGAWVVLHDIDLPRVALEHEARTGTRVDWHHHGPMWLYQGWPFEKFRGVGAGENIGAIRIPFGRHIEAADLSDIIARPWEVEIDPEMNSVLFEHDSSNRRRSA